LFIITYGFYLHEKLDKTTHPFVQHNIDIIYSNWSNVYTTSCLQLLSNIYLFSLLHANTTPTNTVKSLQCMLQQTSKLLKSTD